MKSLVPGLQLDAINAVRGTCIAFDTLSQKSDRYCFKVPYADLWDGKGEGIELATAHNNYDWTFTTLVGGMVTQGDGESFTPSPQQSASTTKTSRRGAGHSLV